MTTGIYEAAEGSEVISENDVIIDKFGGNTSLECILLSTRPNLSKNCGKNVKGKRNLPEYFNEEATTATTASICHLIQCHPVSSVIPRCLHQALSMGVQPGPA